MKRLMFSATIVLASASFACAQEQAVRIRCEISVPRTLSRAEPARLVFALTNDSGEPLQVLNWQTPFEGIASPMFDVTRNGAAIEYRGRMLKRGSPRKEDYLVLKPGERKAATINLADGWDVDAPGSYTVIYAGELFDVVSGTTPLPRGLDELNAVPLRCGEATFTRAK